MSRPGRDRPITGLCVVSRTASCPTGYDVLYTTHDTHDSCNLWPVSFFGAHTDRFLCYCRNVQHEYWSDADKILVDIMLIGEKDVPPTGYTMIQFTRDNGEKATKKKVICVKMKPRNSVQTAVCEVIMLSEKRSIPKDFTVKGPRELNGMTICVRIGSVLPSPLPVEQLPSPLHLAQRKQPLPAMQHLSMQPGWNKGVPRQPSMSQYYDPYNYHTATSQQSLVSGLSMYSSGLVTPSTSYNTMSPSPPYNTSFAPPMQHRQSVSKENPLKDVPFELDNILVELEKAHKISVPTVSYRSNVDLDNEYSYSFSQEEAAVGRVLPNWYSQQQPDCF